MREENGRFITTWGEKSRKGRPSKREGKRGEKSRRGERCFLFFERQGGEGERRAAHNRKEGGEASNTGGRRRG